MRRVCVRALLDVCFGKSDHKSLWGDAQNCAKNRKWILTKLLLDKEGM